MKIENVFFGCGGQTTEYNISFHDHVQYEHHHVVCFLFCSGFFLCIRNVCVCVRHVFLCLSMVVVICTVQLNMNFSQEHVLFSLSYVGYHKTLIVVSCIETNRNKCGTHRSSVQCPSPYMSYGAVSTSHSASHNSIGGDLLPLSLDSYLHVFLIRYAALLAPKRRESGKNATHEMKDALNVELSVRRIQATKNI